MGLEIQAKYILPVEVLETVGNPAERARLPGVVRCCRAEDNTGATCEVELRRHDHVLWECVDGLVDPVILRVADLCALSGTVCPAVVGRQATAVVVSEFDHHPLQHRVCVLANETKGRCGFCFPS